MVKIGGLQKMTLLDYPGKVACTVFLQGCNLRCPFCHNSDLLTGSGSTAMATEEFFDFLQKRRGLLDAVCVSGGEPTIQAGLEGFVARIKALGYAVKLDTNGSNPGVLKKLVHAGLVDYVAMDIKNSPSRYPETVGACHLHLKNLEESIAFLMSGNVEYEFRTTVVEEFHDDQSILEMGMWIREISPEKNIKKLFLQPFADRDSVAFSGLHAPETRKMTHYAELLRPFAREVFIRG